MGEYTVTRNTTIAALPDRIYPLLVDLHEWQRWSPWEDLDPDLHRDYSGADSGVGAKYAWSGNRKAGKGTMEVIEVTEPTRVAVAVAFEKPMSSTSTSVFTMAPRGAQTEVTWTMTGPHSMFSRITAPLGLFDRMIGKDFEKGLAALKSVAEVSGGQRE
ncbi:MAG: transcriptional regulator [Gordonia sp.]|uniref:SRPBCC family protein n=1 Tax=Gordonia sp. (in: high G+C Gram-positive bacteria) TaxID=84139 RepID=UPI000C3CEFC1|nr:SRPBCC family protein [Gordonia sp. (in: high G+C Gram-positive bacteria)]MAU82499.1 transcriptional regulator [Gordonia sp. (in: high G+C Gram-positive bacteria)]